MIAHLSSPHANLAKVLTFSNCCGFLIYVRILSNLLRWEINKTDQIKKMKWEI